jgi:hypothetical protein
LKEKDFRYALMPRDRELLRYLFATKGATRDQINRDIFGSISPKTVNRRLKKLKTAGLIDSSSKFVERFLGIYFASRSAIKSGYVYNFSLPRIETRSSNLEHELALVDIRHKFLNLKNLEHYLTENELQSGVWRGKDHQYDDYIRLNSDAFLRAKIGKNFYSGAIEYEHSEKGKSRYESLFSDYYLSPNVSFVFYIVDHEKFFDTVFRNDKNVRGSRKGIIFVSTLENVLKAEKSISFLSSNSGTLELPLRTL